MSATNQKALIAAPHYWTSPFQVAGQHLARAFAAEGWDVAYVSNPISPLHLARGWTSDLQERAAIYRQGGLTTSGGAVWAYVPGALLTPNRGPLVGSRWVHRHWDRLSVPNVVARIRNQGFGHVDLLYIDAVVQGFWLDAIGHERSVLRIGDRMSAFGQFTAEMASLQGDVARRVDLVAYSAMQLRSEVEHLGAARAVHFPNGADIFHFATDPAPPAPADLSAVPRPIAIYVGAMDEWFDFETVNELTAALSGVSFVLVGPDALARRRLTARPNLHLFGSRPYEQIPAYVRNADVGLIPFDVRRHPHLVNSVHPLKLYEYLASGLPVVATKWKEIATLESPATALCESSAEFAVALTSALSTRPDPAATAIFLQAADWRVRVRKLISLAAAL